MSDELVRQIDAAPVPAWEAKIDLIKRTVAVGASNDELELFFHQARRCGLDPLAKQIYAIKRQGKMAIQVGIDGYRLIAHRTGECAGIDDAEFSGEVPGGYPAAAKVTVYRFVQGQRCAFSITARWAEFFPGDQQGFQWKKMPHVMLGKVAEAQALRKAFPAELGGMYVDAEMDQAGQATQYTPPDPPPSNYMTLERAVTMDEQADAVTFLKSAGITPDELSEIKKAAGAIDWRFVMLEAKRRKLTDPGAVLELANGSLDVEHLQAVVDAEFTETEQTP